MRSIDTRVSEVRRNELFSFIASQVAKRGLTAAAIFFLESNRPLAFLASQFLHFVNPVAGIFLPYQDLEDFAMLLEDRRNIDVLITFMEEAQERTNEEERDRAKAASEERRRRLQERREQAK